MIQSWFVAATPVILAAMATFEGKYWQSLNFMKAAVWLLEKGENLKENLWPNMEYECNNEFCENWDEDLCQLRETFRTLRKVLEWNQNCLNILVDLVEW